MDLLKGILFPNLTMPGFGLPGMEGFAPGNALTSLIEQLGGLLSGNASLPPAFGNQATNFSPGGGNGGGFSPVAAAGAATRALGSGLAPTPGGDVSFGGLNGGLDKVSGAFAGQGPSDAKGFSTKYDSIIAEAAQKYGVDANLVKGLMAQESRFNPKAKSPCGAMGLMQLMPGTAKQMGVKNPWDARQNIFGGVKYLAEQLKTFKGNVPKAVAAYNAGPGAVKKYGGIPPYKETKNYVKNVLNNKKTLDKQKTKTGTTDKTKTTSPGKTDGGNKGGGGKTGGVGGTKTGGGAGGDKK